MSNATAYNRDSLVQAIIDVRNGSRLGTAELRNLFADMADDWTAVERELISVFYELGYSLENKDLFNGSFRSMLRNALRIKGQFQVKVSYKKTRVYTDGDRELTADEKGSWFWHIGLTIGQKTKSDDDYQATEQGTEVVGQPIELTSTERMVDKLLQSEDIDRIQAARAMLNALSAESAGFVIAEYLQSHDVKTMAQLQKLAKSQAA